MFKIGVFGSSADVTDRSIEEKAAEVGAELAKQNCIVITGGCPGLPYIAAESAHKHGGEVWGFSPAHNLEEQYKIYTDNDPTIYTKLIYVSSSFELANNVKACRKYRNVISVAACDAGIIISGRWGTLNELTNLLDYGKVIGILTGTGGVSDEIENLMSKIKKETGALVIYDNNPQMLIEKIINTLKNV